MSGVGKTNLVRDLAKLLGMYEKYCEIDVSRSHDDVDSRARGGGSRFGFGNSSSSVASKLFGVVKDTSEKAILLIDEIQKLNNVGGRYNDVWNLLSDGRLGSGISILSRFESLISDLEFTFEDYDTAMRELAYYKDTNPKGVIDEFGGNILNQQQRWNPYNQPIPTNRRYTIERVEDIVEIKTFEEFSPIFDFIEYGNLQTQFPFGFREYVRCKIASGEMSVDDIWKIPGLFYTKSLLILLKNSQKKVLEKFSDVTGRDPLVFSKLLIFVAGNVDGLYKDYDNINISADELHEKTLKLSSENLKTELLKVFAAEEVARFGGNHIIYPSLNDQSFREIITDTIKLIETDALKTTGIKVKLCSKPYIDYLYKVGVTASLGARPLISRVQSEVSTILPKLIKSAILSGEKEISVTSLKQKYN